MADLAAREAAPEAAARELRLMLALIGSDDAAGCTMSETMEAYVCAGPVSITRSRSLTADADIHGSSSDNSLVRLSLDGCDFEELADLAAREAAPEAAARELRLMLALIGSYDAAGWTELTCIRGPTCCCCSVGASITLLFLEMSGTTEGKSEPLDPMSDGCAGRSN